MQRRVPSRWSLAPLVLVASASAALGQPGGRPPLELLGTWRGTSTCTDRVAAPACHDEVVVYEFMAGAKPGTVHWKADKIVQGQREPMYETDLAYDAGEACWRTEFSSPRSPSMRGAWCLAVDGAHLTGTGLLLPGGQKFRKIDAQKDRGAAP